MPVFINRKKKRSQHPKKRISKVVVVSAIYTQTLYIHVYTSMHTYVIYIHIHIHIHGIYIYVCALAYTEHIADL